MSATPGPGAAPLQFHPPVAQEDQARAGYYALLSRLYYAGPDAALLEAIAGAEGMVAEDGSPLSQAWSSLAMAAKAMDAEAAQLEYDAVFVGTGKAEVTPYASHYLAATGREKILVRLKDRLAEMALAKAQSAREPEDHFAGLFEVMRHLISESTDVALQKQKPFFLQFIAPSYPAFCAAISECASANFYRRVATFTQLFLDIETESLKVF